jgi:hypothetical protein
MLTVIAVCAAGVARQYVRFILVVTIPLLIALLVVWGWLVPNQHPASYHSGITFAVANWLRVAATGAAFQAFLIPLIDHPAELHRFLRETRVSPSIVHVLVTAVIFLPEVGRRLARLMDARAAQGYPNGPIARLMATPKLLMPLVASLVDTAIRRAEFWSHRGVLVPRVIAARPTAPVLIQLAPLALGIGALCASLTL